MRTVSKRKYAAGEKVTVSIRLPESLKKALEDFSEERGWGFSDFVQEGLDQWAELHAEQPTKKAPKGKT